MDDDDLNIKIQDFFNKQENKEMLKTMKRRVQGHSDYADAMSSAEEKPKEELRDKYASAVTVCPWCKAQPNVKQRGSNWTIYCENDVCQVKPEITVNSGLGAFVEWNYDRTPEESLALKNSCEL